MSLKKTNNRDLKFTNLKIAVNTRLLIPNKLEGIGWFTYESLKRITNNHPEHEFIFIFDRDFSDEFIFSKNIKPVIAKPVTRHPVLWYLWLEYTIPKVLKKHNIDLFLSPDGFLSLSTNIPSVAVIHDINFVHQPQDIPLLAEKYYNYYFPKFAKKSNRIATVSNYSKMDIVNEFGIDANKIDVVYNGANTKFKAISKDIAEKTKKQFSEGSDYFVFVGALHPRKNIARLLQAYDVFCKESSKNIKLVLVGDMMFKTKNIENIYTNMMYKSNVIFTGRLSPDVLRDVIASALALTFVPYFEGFGIPIVEAMYCDTPVITSNVTSMPEVGGDACILVDPFSVNSIKNAMLKISDSDFLRKSLIEKGRIQRELFTWDKTAEKLWSTIEKAFL